MEVELTARKNRAAYYLLKPYEFRELENALEAAVGADIKS
jgi:hypothetical protein